MPKKDIFDRKLKKMNITIELYIFELVSVPNFSLNHGVINSMLKLIILIFWTKFTQKKYFWSKTEKSEHNPLIVHIQISRGTKFHLKLKSLLFWTKFTQKGYFHWKTEKVDTTIHFYILELA